MNISHLSETTRQVIECVGIEGYLKLSKNFGGNYLYITGYERVQMLERNKNIVSEFDGYNLKQLSLKYKLSIVQIRNILKDSSAEK